MPLITSEEILDTIRMVQMESLDIRAVTLSLNTMDCHGGSAKQVGSRIAKKVFRVAKRLVQVADDIESEFGVPVVNKRVATTPAAEVIEGVSDLQVGAVAKSMDQVAKDIGIDL